MSGPSRVSKVLGAIVFYGLIVVIVLTAIAYGTVEPWSQAIFECSIFALALLWVVQGLLAGSWHPGNLQLFYPLIALTGFAILQSLAWSQIPAAGIKVVNAISADPFESWLFALRASALTLAGILGVRFARDSARLKILVHAIIILASISAVFGIVRQTMQHDQGFLLPALRYGGGFAQFINKNHFAFLVEPAMGLLAGITVLREHHRRHLLVYFSAIILLWVALVMSNSRGGLLAVTVQMIFAGLLFIYLKAQKRHQVDRGRRRWAYSFGVTALTAIVLVIVIGAGVAWLGGDQLSTGIQTAAIEMKSPDSHEGSRRRDIWNATWQMARAHPILGAGLGGFWAEVPVYHDASGLQTPAQAHNDYLELLASAGLVGIALFVWFVAMLIRTARSVFGTRTGFQRAAALGALVGIVGVAVHSLVDFGLHITGNALVFVMLLSILSVDKITNGPKRKRIKKPRSDNVQANERSTILKKPHTELNQLKKPNRYAIALVVVLISQTLFGWPQDITGGAASLIGQDIIGGASIVFKRPPRVRDLAGGAASLIARHRPPRRTTGPTEIARNRPTASPSPGTPQPQPTPAETSTQDKVDALNDQGNTLYDSRDYAKALDTYQQALKLKPDDALSLNNIGVTYLALSQNQPAIESFQRATKAKADDADSFFNLGVAYNSAEKYEEAAAALNRALALKPDWPDALIALGDTYLQLGRYEDAAKTYENIVKLQPDNVSAYNNLAYAYDRAGRYEDSIRVLKKVVQLNPSDAFGFNNLGAASYKAGKYKDAVDAFTEALRLNPNDAETMNNLGAAQYALEKYGDAAKSFQQAAKLRPAFADAEYNLGNSLLMSAKLSDAADAYQQAIAHKNNYPEAQNNLGIALTNLNRFAEAVTAFKEAARLKPDLATIFNNLAFAEDKTGNDTQAIADYKEAIRLDPKYAKALNGLGYLYDKNGQPDQAIDLLKQAVAIKPDYVAAHYNLGKALFDAKRFAEAVLSYRQATQLKPDYEQAYLGLGTAAFLAGQFPDAADAFKKASLLNPTSVEAFYGLGNSSYRANRLQDAQAALKATLKLKPDYAQAHYSLGLVYASLNDKDGVTREFAILKRLDPKLAEQLYSAVKK